VARQYVAQRAYPPDVARAVGGAIAAQCGSGARVLEIGVGTGRIALPAVEAGCRVVGFDLSAEMLAQISLQNPPPGLSTLRADMHRIPLRENSVDGALAVHVLHLTKDLPTVLDEVARVLRPGGVFIEGNDWLDPQSVTGLLRDELRAEVARRVPAFMPPAAQAVKAPLLALLGGEFVGEIMAVEWTTQMSPAERLDDIAARRDNESWVLPPDLFEAVVQHLRAVAAATWPDLETPQPVTRRFTMKVWRGDWQPL
jgi:SAM-dependent methyltransferase